MGHTENDRLVTMSLEMAIKLRMAELETLNEHEAVQSLQQEINFSQANKWGFSALGVLGLGWSFGLTVADVVSSSLISQSIQELTIDLNWLARGLTRDAPVIAAFLFVGIFAFHWAKQYSLEVLNEALDKTYQK